MAVVLFLIALVKPNCYFLYRTVFNGLKNYLKEAPWQKRETYFSKCFPTLIQYALDIEKNSPQHGPTFAVQNVGMYIIKPCLYQPAAVCLKNTDG